MGVGTSIMIQEKALSIKILKVVELTFQKFCQAFSERLEYDKNTLCVLKFLPISGTKFLFMNQNSSLNGSPINVNNN